jgi:hypothetical protein
MRALGWLCGFFPFGDTFTLMVFLGAILSRFVDGLCSMACVPSRPHFISTFILLHVLAFLIFFPLLPALRICRS